MYARALAMGLPIGNFCGTSSARSTENVALNDYSRTRTVAVAVQGWLHSPHHLENIAGEYDHTGVGVARAADGTFYYTQLFVSRRR